MFLVPKEQLSRCDRIMQQRVGPHVHVAVSRCSLRVFDIPGEPVPSDEFLAEVRVGNIEFRQFSIPGEWGTSWGTTWFEVTGQLDTPAVQGQRIELVADLGWIDRGPGFQSEGLAYRADGTAIKAINPRNSWVPLVASDGTHNCEMDSVGRFTLYIEAAANPFVEGQTPFSPTDLGEAATGKPDSPYTLRRMEVCVFNEKIHEYLLDLDTVSSLMRELHDDDPRYWQLAKALQRSLNLYDERDPDTVAAARGTLGGVLAAPARSSVIHHVAVGHAHIDSAWLWPVRETRRKVARTVSNVLALMDEDPRFTYAMSSAQQYAWLEQDHPDLFARVKQRIDEGRFIPVGGMWVESDGMLPAGESLIRQITFGRRYFKEHLGVQPRGIWLPDSFGYTGAWPQIARRAGYEWFLTQKISWNDTTKFPHHSFMWQGIDGTPILTHFPPSDTYCSSMDMKEVVYSQRNFLDKDLSRNAILLYGYGDGGGGPTREMTARVRRLENLDGAPVVRFGTPDELFDLVKADIGDNAEDETPIFKGELYLELHRATLTAQQDMKRGCREEESMLRAVEYLCAAAQVANASYAYPRQVLDDIWKTLMLNQFHDILPGSAIAWVHRQARAEYRRDLRRLVQIVGQACEAIAVARPGCEIIAKARILPVAPKTEDSWKALPAQPLDVGGRWSASVERVGNTVILDNGLVRAVVEQNGTISSFRDLRHERELVPTGSQLGRYELLRDEPYQWDAWDIQRDAFLCSQGLDHSVIEDAATGCQGNASVRIRGDADGVSIVTTIILRRGVARVEFTANVDWHVQEKFLKVDMPVNVQAAVAQYECQYGMVERPIQKNTRADEAEFESCTHRFIRVADSGYAAAVVNASTYGSDVSPIRGNGGRIADQGTMIRLSLLSAPLYPDPKTDQGRHSFTWSLLADADMSTVLAEASRLNGPVLDCVPDFQPLVQVQPVRGTIAVDWVKLADDGSADLIVRLYEAAGGSAVGRLHCCDELQHCPIREVDLLEGGDVPSELRQAISQEQSDHAEGTRIELAPFQLSTLRLYR